MKNQLQEIPEQRKIPVSRLFVDREAYQRGLTESTLKRIKVWDWKACGALVVAPRPGGMYAVTDGGHRLQRAIELGIESLPCVVIESDGIMDEADSFHKINRNRSAASAYDVLRSLAAMEDVDAINICRIVERNGFQLSNSVGKNRIVSAHALMSAYDTYGSKALDAGLGLLRDVWGGDEQSVNSGFIQGAARFFYYANPQHLHYGEFVAKLAKLKPSQVQIMYPDYVKPPSQKAAIAFGKVYNANRRSDKIPEAIFGQPVATIAAAKKAAKAS